MWNQLLCQGGDTSKFCQDPLDFPFCIDSSWLILLKSKVADLSPQKHGSETIRYPQMGFHSLDLKIGEFPGFGGFV